MGIRIREGSEEGRMEEGRKMVGLLEGESDGRKEGWEGDRSYLHEWLQLW